jgi:hypothetical protein
MYYLAFHIFFECTHQKKSQHQIFNYATARQINKYAYIGRKVLIHLDYFSSKSEIYFDAIFYFILIFFQLNSKLFFVYNIFLYFALIKLERDEYY